MMVRIGVLQAGVATADRILTVSPGYSWEIKTPEGGWGLEQMLSQRSFALNGVLNGIDDVEWNPELDEHIPQNYSLATVAAGKAACKRALQAELNLPQRDNVSDEP